MSGEFSPHFSLRFSFHRDLIFFKRNPPAAFYARLAEKVGSTHLGDRLYSDDDVRVDLGEEVDGGVNIVWQPQKHTEHPALKEIQSTHAEIATQTLDPNNTENGAELSKDLFTKTHKIVVFSFVVLPAPSKALYTCDHPSLRLGLQTQPVFHHNSRGSTVARRRQRLNLFEGVRETRAMLFDDPSRTEERCLPLPPHVLVVAVVVLPILLAPFDLLWVGNCRGSYTELVHYRAAVNCVGAGDSLVQGFKVWVLCVQVVWIWSSVIRGFSSSSSLPGGRQFACSVGPAGLLGHLRRSCIANKKEMDLELISPPTVNHAREGAVRDIVDVCEPRLLGLTDLVQQSRSWPQVPRVESHHFSGQCFQVSCPKLFVDRVGQSKDSTFVPQFDCFSECLASLDSASVSLCFFSRSNSRNRGRQRGPCEGRPGRHKYTTSVAQPLQRPRSHREQFILIQYKRMDPSASCLEVEDSTVVWRGWSYVLLADVKLLDGRLCHMFRRSMTGAAEYQHTRRGNMSNYRPFERVRVMRILMTVFRVPLVSLRRWNLGLDQQRQSGGCPEPIKGLFVGGSSEPTIGTNTSEPTI
ncbi:hypothetical protein GGX14DRAFT_408720 [Mycena pura]|uniref:Uncharacterized protein n=1 Tax=Mycena pura TaxID=153505 RepID=A0AAD6UNN6_9AGAR|nr:hypothetical protein GGX14DRAFT_408720 [Mycena pura]